MNKINYRMIKTNCKYFLLFILLISNISTLSSQNIRYVDANISVSGDGKSWGTAYKDLQDAFSDLNSYQSTVDQIWIAKGTYYADKGKYATQGNSSSYFEIYNISNRNIKILGGFPAGGGSLSDIDYSNEVILDGNIGNIQNKTDNSKSLMKISYVSKEVLIDGIQFKNSYSSTTFSFTYSAKLKISNCAFLSNETGFVNVIDLYSSNEEISFENTKFENNITTSGIVSTLLIKGELYFENCIFNNNSSGNGGALNLYTENNIYISNCNFTKNTSNATGGACVINTAYPVYIANCIFKENKSQTDGGAIYIDKYHLSPLVEITNSLLCGNNSGSYGGAIFSTGQKLHITNSTLTENQASINGGGIFNRDQDWRANEELTILNSVIFNNTITTSGTQNQIASYLGIHEVNYSCISETVPNGNNNITTSPSFIQSGTWNSGYSVWTEGNYQLSDNSPCLGKGDPTTSESIFIKNDQNQAIDLLGNPRFSNTIDIGAYEFVNTVHLQTLPEYVEENYSEYALFAFNLLSVSADVKTQEGIYANIGTGDDFSDSNKSATQITSGGIGNIDATSNLFIDDNNIPVGNVSIIKVDAQEYSYINVPTSVVPTISSVSYSDLDKKFKKDELKLNEDEQSNLTSTSSGTSITINYNTSAAVTLSENTIYKDVVVGDDGILNINSGVYYINRLALEKYTGERSGQKGAILNLNVIDNKPIIIYCNNLMVMGGTTINSENSTPSKVFTYINNNFNTNSGSSFYGTVVAPNTNIYVSNGHNGQIIAKDIYASTDIIFDPYTTDDGGVDDVTYNLKVMHKDGQISNSQFFNPIYYIENNDDKDISDFTVHYYFTLEKGETYNANANEIYNCTYSISQYSDSIYEIIWDFTGKTLAAHTRIPQYNVENIQVNYSSWKSQNLNNDHSYAANVNFTENNKIVIKNSAGKIIYGIAPDNTGIPEINRGNIRYVDISAQAGGDGLSWETAYKDLQDAFHDMADMSLEVKVDEIRIAKGVYYPDRGTNVTLGNRSASFRTGNITDRNIKILGGFPSGGGNILERNTSNITEISGDIGVTGNNNDNSYQLFTIETISEIGSCLIDGITFSNQNGGSNTVLVSSSLGKLDIKNCIFKSNSSSSDIINISNLKHGISIDNCLFSGNISTGESIRFYNMSTEINITKTKFNNNTANSNIDFVQLLSSIIEINNCEFNSNTTSYGAVHFGMFSNEITANILNCKFISNKGYQNSDIGAGAILSEIIGSIHIKNCLFENNYSSRSGGAFCIIPYSGSGVTDIVNSLFIGNKAGIEGGALALACPVNIYNCTFAENYAKTQGSVVHLYNGTAKYSNGRANISNSILWGNKAGNYSIGNPETDKAQFSQVSNSSITSCLSINYSCIEDSNPNDSYIFPSPSGQTNNNIDQDPNFNTNGQWNSDYSVWTKGNYTLQKVSPCIGIGDNNISKDLFIKNSGGTEIDLNNNQRFIYTIDLGAYENNAGVVVWSKNEGLNETNISKPVVLIENDGPVDINGFYVYYYFTIEDGKTLGNPTVYHLNGISAEYIQIEGNNYVLKFNLSSTTLAANSVFPDQGGFKFGINYSDWSTLSKDNDYSFIDGTEFVMNPKIVVTDIYGNILWGSGDLINTPNSFVVINTNDAGEGSLRAAINAANNTSGYNEITFAIPGDGVKTINLLSELSAISESCYINAKSQGDSVYISGNSSIQGLTINSSNVSVSGLSIRDFNSGITTSSNINNISISELAILNSNSSAIVLDNVSNSQISKINIINTTGNGILLSGNNNSVSECEIINCAENGILLTTGEANTFSKNIIYNSGEKAINLAGGSNNLITTPGIYNVVKTETGYTLTVFANENNSSFDIFVGDNSGQNAFEYVQSTNTYIGNGKWTLNIVQEEIENVSFVVTTTDLLGNTSELGSLIDPCLIVVNTNNSGEGSLRNAITCANSKSDKTTIYFDLNGDDKYEIELATSLPKITNSLNIDASYYDLTLNGIDKSFNGIEINTSDVTIKGLNIANFNNGIVLESGAERNNIDNINVTEVKGSGILLNGSDNNGISNSQITNCENQGINVTGNSNIFQNLTIKNCEQNGLNIIGNNNKINNDSIANCGENGITIIEGDFNNITEVIITEIEKSPILLKFTDDQKIDWSNSSIKTANIQKVNFNNTYCTLIIYSDYDQSFNPTFEVYVTNEIGNETSFKIDDLDISNLQTNNKLWSITFPWSDPNQLNFGILTSLPDGNTSELGTSCLVVKNVNDSGPGSLRNAIECANSAPDFNIIRFNIKSDSQELSINLLSELPKIYTPIYIDGKMGSTLKHFSDTIYTRKTIGNDSPESDEDVEMVYEMQIVSDSTSVSNKRIIISGDIARFNGLEFAKDATIDLGDNICGVENLEFTNFENGIVYNNFGKCLFQSISSYSNSKNGIEILNASDEVDIRFSSFSDNSISGINISERDQGAISIRNNEISDNSNGISSLNSNIDSISYNVCTNNENNGILVNNSNVKMIEGNKIYGNSLKGLSITHSICDSIKNNKIGTDFYTIEGNETGIYINDVSTSNNDSILIKNNVIVKSKTFGIELDSCKAILQSNYIGVFPIDFVKSDVLIDSDNSNLNQILDNGISNYTTQEFVYAGNDSSGIKALDSAFVHIGIMSMTLDEGNIIGKNGGHGIDFCNGVIAGNLIGLSIELKDIGNAKSGIFNKNKIQKTFVDTIRNNAIGFNGTDGISGANFSIIKDNRIGGIGSFSFANNGSGINGDQYLSIEDNDISFNKEDGIKTNTNLGKITNNRFEQNGLNAINRINTPYPAPYNISFVKDGDNIILSGFAQKGDVIEIFKGTKNLQDAVKLAATITTTSTNWTVTIPKGEFFNRNTRSYYVATATSPSKNTSELSEHIVVEPEGNNFYVTNTDDAGSGSLREAILLANASDDFNTILFEIPTSYFNTDALKYIIDLYSPLPIIEYPVAILASTQNNVHKDDPYFTFELPIPVVINSLFGDEGNGFEIGTSTSNIDSIVIKGFCFKSFDNAIVNKGNISNMYIDSCEFNGSIDAQIALINAENINIARTTINSAGSDGIRISNSSDVKISEKVSIVDAFGCGVNIKNCSNIMIDSILVKECSKDGICVSISDNIDLTKNIIMDNMGGGIRLNNIQNSEINTNYIGLDKSGIAGNKGNGIELSDDLLLSTSLSENVSIINNIIVDGGFNGLYIENISATDIQVKFNKIGSSSDSNEVDAIQLKNVNNVLFESNILKSSGKNGIHLISGNNNTFTKNTIEGSGKKPILLDYQDTNYSSWSNNSIVRPSIFDVKLNGGNCELTVYSPYRTSNNPEFEVYKTNDLGNELIEYISNISTTPPSSNSNLWKITFPWTDQSNLLFGATVTLPDGNTSAFGASCLVVNSMADAGVGTLRHAIECANYLDDKSNITFDLYDENGIEINLVTVLPSIYTPVSIIGKEDDNIKIDGTNITSNGSGLKFDDASENNSAVTSELQNLDLIGFVNGIEISGITKIEISKIKLTNNTIGLKASGDNNEITISKVSVNENNTGISFESSDDNSIEISESEFTENTSNAIAFENCTNSVITINSNIIQDNDGDGINILNTSNISSLNENIIGGNNVGINISSSSVNEFVNNSIGFNNLKNSANGNTYGVKISGSNSIILNKNEIIASTQDGININNSNNCVIDLNYIGVDRTRTKQDCGNSGNGISGTQNTDLKIMNNYIGNNNIGISGCDSAVIAKNMIGGENNGIKYPNTTYGIDGYDYKRIESNIFIDNPNGGVNLTNGRTIISMNIFKDTRKTNTSAKAINIENTNKHLPATIDSYVSLSYKVTIEGTAQNSDSVEIFKTGKDSAQQALLFVQKVPVINGKYTASFFKGEYFDPLQNNYYVNIALHTTENGKRYSSELSDIFTVEPDFCLKVEEENPTDFLIASEAGINDEVVIINISENTADSIVWEKNKDRFNPTIEGDLLITEFESIGTYEITMRSYYEGCESTVIYSIVIGEESKGGVDGRVYPYKIISAYLYPNPVIGISKLNVQLTESTKLHISIISELGTLSKSFDFTPSATDVETNIEISIDGSELINGTYYLNVEAGIGDYRVIPFIKK